MFTILVKRGFETLKEMQNSSMNASKRRDLYVGLANAKDPHHVLDWSLSTDIRKQDFLLGYKPLLSGIPKYSTGLRKNSKKSKKHSEV